MVGSLPLLYFLLFIVDTVAVVDVGVGVGVDIIINPPNSSSGRCNDIAAAIDTITIVVVVVVANSVVIINPHNTNSGRFINIAVVVVYVHNLVWDRARVKQTNDKDIKMFLNFL